MEIMEVRHESISVRRQERSVRRRGFLGELSVDLTSRLVTCRGIEIALTPTEYDILRLLVVNAGKVLTHTQILRHVWGAAYVEQPHVLRVNISNLRRKLEENPSTPKHIITEPGVGYRLKTAS